MKEKPLKDILKSIIKNLEKNKGEKDGNVIVEAWREISGALAKNTKPVSFKAGRLVVYVSDSSRLYELTIKTKELIKDINKKLKAKKKKNLRACVVKTIRFKIGEV